MARKPIAMLAIASATRSKEVYLTHAEIDGSLTMKADKAMTMGAAIPRPESVAVDFCSRCSERVLAASQSCSILCSNFGRIVPFGEFVVMLCSGDGAVPYAESVWCSNTKKVAMLFFAASTYVRKETGRRLGGLER
jgi:hypothetical protein